LLPGDGDRRTWRERRTLWAAEDESFNHCRSTKERIEHTGAAQLGLKGSADEEVVEDHIAANRFEVRGINFGI